MLDLTTYLKAGETSVSNLVLTHYRSLGMSDQELILYLKLVQYQQQGVLFPDLMVISQQMGYQPEDIFQMLQGLIDKEIIKLITTKNDQGQTTDAYDLTGLFSKIDKLQQATHKKETQLSVEFQSRELYQVFEQEFGRPLSPIELETIGLWLKEDQYEPEIIRLALREAVLNQAYSLKYIDRILLSWERKNLKSKEQIIADQQKRKKSLADDERQQTNQPGQDLPKVPLYNWLDPKA
ncbi:DnaD domain protein [Vagococcus coleopterorum]|uniref:DnaD domain protein n=1 Tax=Vagococcus coleopterorum TaxID=2714946 RepID=A0A6G8ANG5_9ENTE|nr:DnaD domain protein [Vagococcus coleopterorum]QIL46482.1 DnaD domain protein [Vagococcus coleopterorum]